MSSTDLGPCTYETRFRNLPRKDSYLLVLIKSKETNICTARAFMSSIKVKNYHISYFTDFSDSKVQKWFVMLINVFCKWHIDMLRQPPLNCRRMH